MPSQQPTISWVSLNTCIVGLLLFHDGSSVTCCTLFVVLVLMFLKVKLTSHWLNIELPCGRFWVQTRARGCPANTPA